MGLCRRHRRRGRLTADDERDMFRLSLGAPAPNARAINLLPV